MSIDAEIAARSNIEFDANLRAGEVGYPGNVDRGSYFKLRVIVTDRN